MFPKMEVEVISRETIKPSSPTPPHLRTYKISLLDQFYPTTHTPFFIYYHPSKTNDMNMNSNINININQRLAQLKDSLSETLTRFYPLAGRVQDDNLSIDCNDQGILFFTTHVKCQMAKLLSLRQQPQIGKQSELLPWLPGSGPGPGPVSDVAQVAIQLNIFDCGGVAFGMLFLHKIIDATTFSAFLRCWAGIAGGSSGVWPDYSAASRFPQRESLPDDFSSALFKEKSLLGEAKEGGAAAGRRFVFDAAAITILKARAASKLVPDPTRVEAVSCFIWKHAMAASGVASGSGVRKPSILGCATDLRRRMEPSLSEYSFGNIAWKSVAFCDEVRGGSPTDESELHGLVGLLRAALKKTKDDFVPKLQGRGGGGGYEAICKYFEETTQTCSIKNLNPYTLTSWCRMGFTAVDFGWGKPGWVSFLGGEVDSRFKNIIVLVEAISGSGCDGKSEAWIFLDPLEMAILENDLQFLAFASLNPALSDPVTPSSS